MRIRAERAGQGAEPGFGWELALLVAGAGVLLAAPAVSMVRARPVEFPAQIGPREFRPSVDPAFTAEPLLGVLAVLPVAAAVVLLVTGARTATLGLVVGVGALAPARAVTDAQLFTDPNRANRPELFVPSSLAELEHRTGPVLLMVGHGLLFLAAVVAVLRWTRRTEAVGAVAGMDFDEPARGRRQGLLAAVLLLGAAAGIGLLSAPFHSDNPYLVGESALDAAAWTTAGGVALAAGTPVVAWLLASSPDVGRGVGGVLGVALAVLAVVVPPLATAGLEDDVTFAPGPLVALLAVVVMVGWAVQVARRDGPAGAQPAETSETDVPDLPAVGVLQRVAGAVAVLAAAAAFGGWAFDAINSDDGLDAPGVPATRLLIPVAVLVAALGAAVLAGGARAGVLRPVLTVALVTVPMAAAPVLDAGLTARDYSGLEVGPGSWIALVAMPIAGLAAILAAVAGGVERDDVDLSALADRGPDRVFVAVVVPAAALAVLAFVLPLADAPGYEPVQIWYADGIASWGPVVALAAVLVAIGTAPWCRRSRAAALLVGAATVLGVRVLQYALVEERVDGAEVDAGLWVTVAGIVALLIGVAVTLRPAVRVPAGKGRSSRRH